MSSALPRFFLLALGRGTRREAVGLAAAWTREAEIAEATVPCSVHCCAVRTGSIALPASIKVQIQGE